MYEQLKKTNDLIFVWLRNIHSLNSVIGEDVTIKSAVSD